MTKRYEFWYNIEETWKASFIADSLEHAQELLDAALEEDELSEETLPGYWEKNKGLSRDVDIMGLEFVGEFEE